MKNEVLEETRISVIPEDRIDLILLYYILRKRISNLITRIYWQNKTISQTKTTRLGRKPVDILLEPEDIRFNYNMKRLRVTGRAREASPEEGVKGRKLGADINIGKQIYLENKSEVLEILKLAEIHEYKQFIIIVIDSGGVTLARVFDTISVLDEAYIPSSKFYTTHLNTLNTVIEKTFKKIEELKKQEKNLLVVAAINTFTRKLISKYKKLIDIVVEGDFSGTYTGIIQALKDIKLRKAKINNPILNNIDIYENLFKSMYHKRIVYGIDNIQAAILDRNVIALYINYQLILEKPDLIEYIVIGLKKKIKVVISDKRDFLGIALEKFGGIVGVY